MSSARNVWTENKNKPSLTKTEFPSLNDYSEVGHVGSYTSKNESTSPSQLQKDEVEVLQAIYMEDYEEVDSIAAWTVCR